MGVFYRKAFTGSIPVVFAGMLMACNAPSISGGEKIVLEQTKKVEIPKARDLERGDTDVRIEIDNPTTGIPGGTAAPQAAPKVMDKALQQVIDRQKNWLFYGPDSADAKSDKSIFKSDNKDGELDTKPFKSASEKFMAGEKLNEGSDNKTSGRDERDKANPYKQSDREREEEDSINEEFNISGFLQPQIGAEENRGLRASTSFFENRNQYSIRSYTFNNRPDAASNREKEALKAFDKERAAEFNSILNRSSGSPLDSKSTDPLSRGMGVDGTRRESNPYTPSSSGFRSVQPETAGRGAMPAARAIDIPRPDALNGIGAQAARPAMFGETRFTPPQPARSQPSLSPFGLEVPKKKF